MDIVGSVRRYWDVDAETYDHATSHGFGSSTERAAWTAALEEVLPAPPCRVLDVGAGTGFLSLLAARLGHDVTALDVSRGMLERLTTKAGAEGLDVDVVEGPADEPPDGPFDAVIERHALWTLPDPRGALDAWRRVAPDGRLALFEGLWGEADPAEVRRARLRDLARRLRREPSHHHREYDPAVKDALPLGRGTHPDDVVDLVAASDWGEPSLRRLRDVEWARLLAVPPARRPLGTTPVFVVTTR